MATDTEIKPPVEGEGQTPPPNATELHKYATWLHLGPGAEDCDGLERNDDGEVVSAEGCAERAHFHAWCRMPNSVQHEDIRTKGLAAKARLIRRLRDPETDEAVVLEAELDDLRSAGDSIKESVVEEILQKTFWKAYIDATNDVKELTGEDGETKLYEHIEEDQQRWADLRAMSDEDRTGDQAEYDELTKHLSGYTEAVQARHAEIRQPEKDALLDRDLEELLDMVRQDRIARAGEKQMMDVYSRWEWLVCTLTTVAKEGHRKFADMNALSAAPPEVIDALEETFNDLEQTRNRAAGNG